jgi:pimeloyl-ACP methyl ester carboxylesterase
MTAQIAACPDIKFALAGYSQGGGVVSRAAASLPPALAERVVAVALYGAGDGTRIAAALKSKTIANCAPGDFVSRIFKSSWMLTVLRLVQMVARALGMCLTMIKGPFGMIARQNTSSKHSRALRWDRKR